LKIIQEEKENREIFFEEEIKRFPGASHKKLSVLDSLEDSPYYLKEDISDNYDLTPKEIVNKFSKNNTNFFKKTIQLPVIYSGILSLKDQLSKKI